MESDYQIRWIHWAENTVRKFVGFVFYKGEGESYTTVPVKVDIVKGQVQVPLLVVDQLREKLQVLLDPVPGNWADLDAASEAREDLERLNAAPMEILRALQAEKSILENEYVKFEMNNVEWLKSKGLWVPSIKRSNKSPVKMRARGKGTRKVAKWALTDEDFEVEEEDEDPEIDDRNFIIECNNDPALARMLENAKMVRIGNKIMLEMNSPNLDIVEEAPQKAPERLVEVAPKKVTEPVVVPKPVEVVAPQKVTTPAKIISPTTTDGRAGLTKAEKNRKRNQRRNVVRREKLQAQAKAGKTAVAKSVDAGKTAPTKPIPLVA